VVQAIADSQIPVISAVGHEIDTTLTDLVADVRAPTPSAAAEMVSASRLELAAQLAAMRSGITEALQSRVERIRLLLSQFTPDNLVRNFQIYVQPYALEVEEARGQLKLAMERLLVPSRHRLDLLSQAMLSNSPLAVLQRGYAVASSEKTGQVLMSSRDVNPDDMLQIRLHKGRLRAAVKEKQE
jgi:exodeoxyribonuclease VII large subunit